MSTVSARRNFIYLIRFDVVRDVVTNVLQPNDDGQTKAFRLICIKQSTDESCSDERGGNFRKRNMGKSFDDEQKSRLRQHAPTQHENRSILLL